MNNRPGSSGRHPEVYPEPSATKSLRDKANLPPGPQSPRGRVPGGEHRFCRGATSSSLLALTPRFFWAILGAISDWVGTKTRRNTGIYAVGWHSYCDCLGCNPNQTMTAETRYPLSSLQQGMLFHALYAPSSGVDLEQLVLQTDAPLDLPRLARAFESLLARHNVLRTRFVWEGTDGSPVQEVLPEVDLPFETSTLPLDAFLPADRTRGFTLSEAPLLRVTALSEKTVVWSFSHAILDGRCYPILLQELFALYDGLALPAPPRPYRDFIEFLGARDRSSDVDYWKAQLAGFRAPTPLTVERLGDTEGASGHGLVETALSATQATALNSLAKSQNVTMNTLVQGAWGILLARYSGEEDIVFGATRACRHGSIPGSEAIIGPLINTLPVRVNAALDTALPTYLQALRAQHLAVRPLEHTPLATVQALSELPRGTSLFESLVMFDSVSLTDALGWPDKTVTLHEKTNFALTLRGHLSSHPAAGYPLAGGGMGLSLEFDAARFSESTVQRMLGHLATLLLGMAESPQARLGELPLLTDAEKPEALAPAHFPTPTCLHEIFEEQARKTPDAPAVTLDGVSISYSALNARANRLAHRLRKMGVGPEVLVGLRVERSVEIVVGILAILKAGGAYLPIDLAYPDERVSFMLDDANSPILLTTRANHTNFSFNHTSELSNHYEESSNHIGESSNHYEESYNHVGESSNHICFSSNHDEKPFNVLYLEDDYTEESSDDLLNSQNHPDSPCYVIYTSGSTGKPKGVEITHRNVLRLFASTDEWFGFDSGDVWTLFHSHAFDFSVWEIWGALLHGGRLVVVPYHVSRDPGEFLALLRHEKVTVLNQTPSAFRQLIAADGELPGPNSLRCVIFGGEALDLASLRPWIARHGDQSPRLVNMYGITETCVHVTYRPLSAADIESVRGSVIGVPLPDLSLHVLQPSGEPAPVGVPGELFVGGAGLARGYLNRPELTTERFANNLYKTGDLARTLPDGDIEYLGRIDQQVQLRGFRIELGEIESALHQVSGVAEAVVILREDQPGEQKLVGYVVANPRPTVAEIRDALSQRLPGYMVPPLFVFLEALPLTTNGKTDKKSLPAPAAEARTQEAAPPRTPTEAVLQKIWQDVLRQPEIGVFDSFFERGGDSILSIHVLSKARQAGLNLTARQIFESPTIAQLAALAESAAPAPVVLETLPDGPAPPTPIQKWFFDQNLPDPNHYNQAFVFALKKPVAADALDRALAALAARHDVLTLGFAKTEAHGKLTEPDAEALAARLQSSLNFTDGPIGRGALYVAQSETRLLLVIHHLAVDGVSWRILLEDLEAQLLGNPLPAGAHSFKHWAHALAAYAPEAERPYWEGVLSPSPPAPGNGGANSPITGGQGADTGGQGAKSARTVTVALSAEETRALLHDVPKNLGGRANEILLSALARSLAPWRGDGKYLIELEGHGREEIFPGLDVSRTMGWFTALFPIALTLRAADDARGALRVARETLSAVPNRGVGFGSLRGSLPTFAPEILFNFLGQLDGLCAGSELFALSDGPTGPWHGPTNPPSHPLDILAAVRHERLEVVFTYRSERHNTQSIEALAARYLEALRELILESEKPISYALSPMQTLFYASPESGIETWKFEIHGPLDATRLRHAWEAVVARHDVLRSTFTAERQTVQKSVVLPWSESELPTPTFDLSQAPLMKLALIREREGVHTLHWTTHHLLLDGWSWPLVFAEVAEIYGKPTPHSPLPTSPAMRTYIDYLESRGDASEGFWREALKGFTRPTPLPASLAPDAESTGIGEACATLSPEVATALKNLASKSRWTLSTLVQGAWALTLSRHSGQRDVVFGASFSGRPEALPGALEIVGPLVNNLPVRVQLTDDERLSGFLNRLQSEHLARVENQDASVLKLQSWTDVPLRFRLFESLVVFQNYRSEKQLKLGEASVTLLEAPDHTAFPLTLVVAPGESLEIKLAYHRPRLDQKTALVLLGDLVTLLEAFGSSTGVSLGKLLESLSEPLPAPVLREPMKRVGEQAKSETEQTLARIWQEALGVESVGRADNFFDLGAHSLLLVAVHSRICTALGREVPLLAFFAHPTIAALAASLDGTIGESPRQESVQDRARKQREAQARQRSVRR